ncbi:restriction endonuclease subunit S [Serratia quinivorans]|uniref:restriction endonuclease subunit S n=1 Tax=Serratia quinivorans TaxID=137545 RepID=UPI00217BDE22|nr:restriction endonuclease subunit S [Serratia quinivorans]CAI0991903.1 Type I restriction enzyme EcoKI specificity protein [Serratia quinivorans]
MAKYKAYPEYKDSGVEWFDVMPMRWKVTRLKLETFMNMGQSPSSDDCNIEGNGFAFLQGNAEFGKTNPIEKQYCPVAKKIANPGDILFSVRAPVGAVNYADKKYGIGRGLCSIAASAKVISDFLWWLLPTYKYQLDAIATGSTFEAVSAEQLGNLCFALPSISEQLQIAAFLDLETVKIDNLIERQQQLIELLKEKRQAVISHAVTKGLNPDVPMKDSGVEWLGEVPEHWTIPKIGYFCEVTKLTGFEYTNHWRTDENGEIIALRGFNIKERYLDLARAEKISNELSRKLSRSKLSVGDIVLPCTGTLGNASIISSNNMFHINQNIAKLTFDESIYSEFAAYWLTSEPFREMIEFNNTSGMQPVLLIGDIRNMPMPLPSIQEQIDISIYLNNKLNVYDFAIQRNEHAISLLSERRTALISAAVTGKIDVRNWVAPDAEKTEVSQEATA